MSFQNENTNTFPGDGMRVTLDTQNGSPDVHPESFPSTKNRIRMRICASCRQEVLNFDNESFTCKCCFRFFHVTCCERASSRVCFECSNWHENHDQLTVTNLVSSQHLVDFHEIPGATHRLLNAALIESQRKESWLWKASLEEIRAHNDRLNHMPTLGERIAARQEASSINN